MKMRVQGDPKDKSLEFHLETTATNRVNIITYDENGDIHRIGYFECLFSPDSDEGHCRLVTYEGLSSKYFATNNAGNIRIAEVSN